MAARSFFVLRWSLCRGNIEDVFDKQYFNLFHEAHFNPCNNGKGAAQFKRDVAANPSDTEETIWAFLCDARALGAGPGGGFMAARRALVPPPLQERRPYMRVALELFAGSASEGDLAKVQLSLSFTSPSHVCQMTESCFELEQMLSCGCALRVGVSAINCKRKKERSI